MNTKKILILLAHALVGWAICGGIMGIGLALWTEQTTLIVHAIGAPIVFAIVSWVYFNKFAYTSPLVTGLVFIGLAIFMDAFVVSLIIIGNFDMFASPLGTWIPLASIFLSTLLVGNTLTSKSQSMPGSVG
jgi:hypothetical protein